MTRMRWPINSAAILRAHWQSFLGSGGFMQRGPTDFQSDSVICLLLIENWVEVSILQEREKRTC